MFFLENWNNRITFSGCCVFLRSRICFPQQYFRFDQKISMQFERNLSRIDLIYCSLCLNYYKAQLNWL